MSTINGPVRTKRQASAKRRPADLSASDQLRKQAQKLTKDAQEMGGMATDAVQEKLGQFGEDASEYYEQGREKVHDAQRTVEQFIREQPVKSILIAAGVGLLFGRFWMRR